MPSGEDHVGMGQRRAPGQMDHFFLPLFLYVIAEKLILYIGSIPSFCDHLIIRKPKPIRPCISKLRYPSPSLAHRPSPMSRNPAKTAA
ncbi:hypothetical protein FJTKL_14071 [Diaporthe vaccinii]|uniref:Uncharacterized protein n=1 Tax=Diaporthe vaccinii TaxID=105482 RepID=A0ABR4E8Y1_9PEZI